MSSLPTVQITTNYNIPHIPNIKIDGEYLDEYVGRLYEFFDGSIGLVLSVYVNYCGWPAQVSVTFAGKSGRLDTTLEDFKISLIITENQHTI